MSKRRNGSEEDSDLADLLEEKVPLVTPTAIRAGDASKKNDDATQPKKVTPEWKRHVQSRKYQRPSSNYHEASVGQCLSAYIALLCHFHPFLCGSIAFIIAGSVLLFVGNLLFNPIEEFGVIHSDLSNIRSSYDLTMGRIDHWCLEGGNDDCSCEDPLTPVAKFEQSTWSDAFQENVKVIEQYQDELKAKELDVAFLGASIIEEMDGRWLGVDHGQELTRIRSVFHQHFEKESGAEMEGVALGIAGDTAANVLFRLMHGEMPDYFAPRVWWISLGMNELGRMHCSEEVTVIGILRVVEEILEKRPSAHVVLNSLFPMIEMRGDKYAKTDEYKDALHEEREEEERPEGVRHRQLQELSAAEDRYKRFERLRAMAGHQNHHGTTMTDQHYVRKYNPFTAFTHRHKVPLWTSIRAINQQLKKFAENHDRVTYFDATPIFVEQQDSGKYLLRNSRITPQGHPTPRGYSIWEDKIVETLKPILGKLKSEKPELFGFNGAMDLDDYTGEWDADNLEHDDMFFDPDHLYYEHHEQHHDEPPAEHPHDESAGSDGPDIVDGGMGGGTGPSGSLGEGTVGAEGPDGQRSGSSENGADSSGHGADDVEAEHHNTGTVDAEDHDDDGHGGDDNQGGEHDDDEGGGDDDDNAEGDDEDHEQHGDAEHHNTGMDDAGDDGHGGDDNQGGEHDDDEGGGDDDDNAEGDDADHEQHDDGDDVSQDENDDDGV